MERTGFLTVCTSCRPPTGIEELTIGIIDGRCDNCGKRGASPKLKQFRLRDVLERLAKLEAGNRAEP